MQKCQVFFGGNRPALGGSSPSATGRAGESSRRPVSYHERGVGSIWDEVTYGATETTLW